MLWKEAQSDAESLQNDVLWQTEDLAFATGKVLSQILMPKEESMEKPHPSQRETSALLLFSGFIFWPSVPYL